MHDLARQSHSVYRALHLGESAKSYMFPPALSRGKRRHFHSILSRLAAGYVVAVVLLALTWGVTAQSLRQMDAHITRTVQVDDALWSNVIERVKLMDDEETGLRGYLLTGRPVFLQPLRSAERRLPALREQSTRLISALPSSERDMDSMFERAAAWESWVRSVLAHPTPNPRSPAAVNEQLEGKRLFDLFRRASAAVSAAMASNRLTNLARSGSLEAETDRLTAIIFAGALLITTLVGWITIRAVTRPLARLRSSAEGIGLGHLDRPVPEENAREFAGLAASMDEMRRRLAEEASRRREAEERLKQLALHDPLTGLPNRDLFFDRLEQAMLSSRRNGGPMALLMLDLDRFKQINDTKGHHTGDTVLQAVAARLKNALRMSDTVARLGGDEFAIILPQADRSQAALVARKLEAAVQEPLPVEGEPSDVGVSVGIALFPSDADTAVQLMRHADAEMYAAKAARGDGRRGLDAAS